MREDSGYSTGSIFLSFLLGGIVGAGLALLLAPQSGRETRRRIKEFSDDVRDRVGEQVDTAKEKAASAYESGKDFLEEKKSAMATAIEAGKEAYEKEKGKYAKG